MQRTRNANLLHKRISEYVLLSDFQRLQEENKELRKRLDEALEWINEFRNE
jgi:hypothetical protein